MKVEFRARPQCETTLAAAQRAGFSPLTARLIAGRVESFSGDLRSVVEAGLGNLSDPEGLRDCDGAARRLVRAIAEHEPIGLVTDYDVDGITSHALLLDALIEHFGVPAAQVQGFIGHRLTEGYGLSDPVVDRILAASPVPAVVITADCGSSDEARIARLKAAGVDVIVTDHHGLGEAGPPASAYATVNPVRDDCDYPDGSIAGCMVAWLLMAQVRKCLIADGHLPADAPKLGGLLDFVSLGTVADAVSLFSPSNRAVVQAGLTVMNRLGRPCWRAMARLLKRETFVVDDLGFQLGPRINARGRMDEPKAALRFLRATDDAAADSALAVLDDNNRQRKEAEQRMLAVARAQAESALTPASQSTVVFNEAFHPGVQGIVASRLVELTGRPAVVLSPGREDGQLTGSARSVPGLDIRAAIAEAHDHLPEHFHAFGGHPGAAGLTIAREGLDPFVLAFAVAVRGQMGDVQLGPVCWTDGALEPMQIAIETLKECDCLSPYGREFESPVFDGRFAVVALRPVGDGTHLALELSAGGQQFRAIWFRARKDAEAPLPVEEGVTVRCAYRMERDSWRGNDKVQLVVVHAAPDGA
ncbi:MAG: DHH family phosphoesterase [Pseudomonadota bacterium]